MRSNDSRLVPLGGAMAAALKVITPKVRGRFEPLIDAVQALPEIHVLGGLSLRLYRLMIAADALQEAGLSEETAATLRSAAEAITNLMYIMDVGQSRPDETKSTTQLAEMFIAYGDIAYFKLLSGRPAQSRAAFKRRYGWSDSQVDAHHAECERKRNAALALGCQSSKWHPLELPRMAKEVLKYLPDYADRDFADILLACFATGNSATHGDAMFLRTHYKGHQGRPLEFIRTQNENDFNAISQFVYWAWIRLARYFNDEDWLRGTIQDELRRILKERYDAAASVAGPRILTLESA